MEKKRIYCLIGSSGSGKSTIARVLSKQGCPELISQTTREPRVNERDGVNYYFITEQEYDKMGWVEKETYCGKRYGSSVNEVLGKLAENESVCAVVTYRGYEAFLNFFDGWKNVEVISVRVDGGDANELVKRLTLRQDTEEEIEKRVKQYYTEQELFKGKQFDIIFYNTGREEELEEKVRENILI